MELARWRAITLLAITAAIVVAQEVLLTRVLSVVTWYSLAFAVLSLAMLGLTAGSLQAARAAEAGEPLAAWVARRFLWLAGGLLVADGVTLAVPLVLAPNLTAFASLLLITVANTAPFIAGGAIVARLMSGSTVPMPYLYAADLFAAALGALAPLVLLGPISAPGATALLAACAALAASVAAPRLARRGSAALGILAIAVLLVTELSSAGLGVHQAKNHELSRGWPIAEVKWSPLSFLSRTKFVTTTVPILWAPAPLAREVASTETSEIQIDGDAETFIHAYRDVSELTFLGDDLTSVVHRLRPHGTACVIGMGGGRDVLTALHFGHEHVFAVEINRAIVDMLREVSDRSPLMLDPRVQVVVGDGRSELARSGVRCSVIQASLIDTWAATSAGAFAHSEATLYTREAWSLFLSRLEPDGLLTFTRWYRAGKASETARLVALAVSSLIDRGVADPRAHLAVVTTPGCANLLVSPNPLSDADRAALQRLEGDFGFRVLLSPDRRPDDPVLDRLVAAHTQEELAAAGFPYQLDTSAPTDDRPFFFQLVASSAWLHPTQAYDMVTHAAGVGGGVIPGNLAAMVGMTLVVLAVLLVGTVLLLPTILSSLRSSHPPLPGLSAQVYFSALGAGFMMAEIALMQRMHVILGHPTYALVVVLTGLLVATGLGSLLSARLVRTRRAVTYTAAIAGVLLATIPVVIEPLARATATDPIGLRALWCGGVAAAVGLILGMLFPSGLAFTQRDRGAPAALAVNGLAGIVGSALTVMLSVAFGISSSFVFAGVCYLVAALAGPERWRPIEIEHSPSNVGTA